MALSREYQEKIGDWLRWYNYHRNHLETSGVEQKLAFLMKATYGAYVLIAGLADETHVPTKEAPRLLMPTGLEVRW